MESFEFTESVSLENQQFNNNEENYFTSINELPASGDNTSADYLPSLALVDDQSATNSVQGQTSTNSADTEAPSNESVDRNRTSVFALQEFDNMDSDANGFLSNDELDDYAETNSLTQSEQKMMQVLRRNNDDWQKNINDEYFFENNGVSKLDLAIPFVGKEMSNLVENHFDAMDSDEDGIIKRDEIEEYARQNELSTPEQEAAKMLAEVSDGKSLFNPIGHPVRSGKGLDRESATFWSQIYERAGEKR